MNTEPNSRAASAADPNAPLLNILTPHERSQLFDWFITLELPEVAKKCADDAPNGFGIRFSLEALSAWEHTHRLELIIQRERRCVELARSLVPSQGEGAGDLIQLATFRALQLRLFELATTTHSDVNEIKTLFLLVMEARNYELAERKLEASLEQALAQVAEKASSFSPEEFHAFAHATVGSLLRPRALRTATATPTLTPTPNPSPL